MSASEMSPISLQESQLDQAAELLARVFQHDAMMIYFVANHMRLLDKPLRFYRANIRMGLMYGDVYTTPSMDGLAVWLRPGNTDFTLGQMLRSGLLTGTLSMGLKSMSRFMRSFSAVEGLTKRSISGPHWLLLFLGVDPPQQGKGLGGKLIAPILRRADKERTPCYLESTNERNLTFYKRHGFEIAGEQQIPGGGPMMWAMRREPGASPVED